MRELITRLDCDQDETIEIASKSVSVLDGLVMLQNAWKSVNQTTIKNCFDKCFRFENQSAIQEHLIEEESIFKNVSEQFIECDKTLQCFETCEETMENEEDETTTKCL